MARPTSKLDTSSGRPERLTWIAFVLLLGLVVARGAMQQHLRDPSRATPGGMLSPRTPGPAAGLGLDLLCCVPAILVLIRRVTDKTFSLRLAWSFVPLALLSGWMFLSTLWAADRFAAAVSSFHWVAAAAVLWAAAQLVRGWLKLRLVAAVCFALLPVYAIEGFIYRFQDLPTLRKFFDENRTQSLAERNIAPGSFQAGAFEGKLKQGEMMGFFNSSNTFGAAVSLLLVLGVGIINQQCADRYAIKWAVPTAGIAMAAGMVILALTRSRGAFATLGIALALFLLVWKTRARLAAHARRYFFAGLALVAFTLFAVIGHGLFHGSLPTRTLTFRWHYWVGATRLFKHHPILGVGWENFGANYLAYRLPQAPEEVKDPHNFIVRFFVELGLVGGILLIAWLVRLWWELTRPVTPLGAALPAAKTRTAGPAAPGVVKFATAVAGLATLIYLAFGADWARNAFENFLLKWLLFCVAMILTVSLIGLHSLETQAADDRPAPWILYGILLAIAGLLVHNLIDFSLFEVGPMFLFALLTGSVVGVRQSAALDERSKSGPVALALTGVVVLFLSVALFLWGPIVAAQRSTDQADELVWSMKLTEGVPDDPGLVARQGEEAVNLMAEAAALVPMNAEYSLGAAHYALETVRLLQAARGRATSVDLGSATSSLVTQARTLVDRAVRANPGNAEGYFMRAYLLVNGPKPDTAAARHDLLEAIALDPNNVDARVKAGDLLARFTSAQDRDFSRHQYEEALRFDSLLAADEMKRLPESQRAAIRRKIEQLGPK